MSIKLALLLALLAAAAGTGFGYLLRLIIALGKKGSVELDIKQMELRAREEAQGIISEAEARSKEIFEKVDVENKEREDRSKKTEDRLIKKEEFLDKRQVDIDKEAEYIKQKAAEIKMIRERADELIEARNSALAQVAGLSPAEAREELLKRVEKEAEEDIVIRMQKLETQAEDRLGDKAREILATAIQRLASSVTGEIMATSVP